MKREKSLNGYRTKMIHVRLTDSEYEKFNDLFEQALNENAELLASDFIRQQLLFENDQRKVTVLINEIRKMRMDVRQALIRFERKNDTKSYEYLKSVMEESNRNLVFIKAKMEEQSGSNSTKKYKGE